jgi:hypothetical protein
MQKTFSPLLERRLATPSLDYAKLPPPIRCGRRGLWWHHRKRRVYQPRVVGDQVMLQDDLERLHKYMLDIEGVDHISDEMRAVVESKWPELVYKLLPKEAH